MKNQISILVFLLCAFQSLFAQNEISGVVLDDQSQPAFFVTVALYEADEEHSLVKGVSTDANGRFVLKGIEDGAYSLEVSLIGSKPYQLDLNFPADHGKAFDVQLELDVAILQTVEVVGKVPLLVQKSDRLVVNIENNIIGLNSNMMDVMKKIPGMLVINDRLRMAGQSNITVLINGKTTRYVDVQSLLRDMPGSNVKSVEVIHQPGAEFDAEGTGPIINVILKKNTLLGTNGNVSIGYDRGTVEGANTAISLSHYQGNLNINGGASLGRYAQFDGLEIERKVGEDTYTQDTYDPGNPLVFQGNLGLDWDVSDRHRLGIDSRYQKGGMNKTIENSTIVDFGDPSETDLLIESNNVMDDDWNLYVLNPYYSFDIDTAGQQLAFDVNYARFYSSSFTTQLSNELNKNDFIAGRRYDQEGVTRIWSSRLDYTKPIGKDLKLQFGGKYSSAKLDNDLVSFLESEGGDWQKDLLQTNRFIYDEDIYAGYTKLTFDVGDWSGTAGLRYERSQALGNSVTLDSTVNRTIAKLFPSFSLQRRLTEEFDAAFAYSYRIERPDYNSLNPFVYYFDPLTYEQGNPLLSPTLAHSMKFHLAYEKQPFFNVEYKIMNDPMVEVTEQNDATGEAYSTQVNLESLKTFHSSFYFPLDFLPGIAGGYGGIMANHVNYNSLYLNEQFDRSRWTYGAEIELEIELPWDIDSEISAYYSSGEQNGTIEGGWVYGMSVGFSKKFFNDNAKFSIQVEDLFNRFYHANINFANVNANLVNSWDAPLLRVGFSYKFGNHHTKGKDKWESSGSNEIDRAN